MIIYKATNIVNGKCYIGQTVKRLSNRKKGHKIDSDRKGYIFCNAIRKYGWDSFLWEVLCECSSKEELDEMEFHYIKQYHSHASEWGYNLTWGGDDNPMFDESVRQKMSIKNSGANNPNYGKSHSEKTKSLMRDNHYDCHGSNNPNYGNRGDKNPISKKWVVTDSDGNEQVITGLEQFCRDNGLTPPCMNAVASGKRKSHKGWKCRRLE